MSTRKFENMLAIGGKSNSLGKVNDVIIEVLANRKLIDDLYGCLFSDDPWVRMRAIDAFEKICRKHPDWIEPFVDRIQSDLSDPQQQASIKWHIAEIYERVHLNNLQKDVALEWLTAQLETTDVDWIVAANCMKTLVHFVEQGDAPRSELLRLLKIQKGHASNSIVKKATSLLEAHSL